MHRLDRTTATEPTCLAGYHYQSQIWDYLCSTCRAEVRAALKMMQGSPMTPGDSDGSTSVVRCAYCEAAIYSGGHIEHFRRKSRTHPNGRPELTFVWDNLFLACDSTDHCGHYKDRPGAAAYSANELIKPDDEDPEKFLYFHSSGEVRIQPNLTPAETHRASETIRVFGLEDSALTALRATAFRIYRNQLADDLVELETWEPELRELYLTEELEKTRWNPYSTTIKHYLLRILS
jgi:uncharacterized protein (TIGR02646 family)